MKRVGIIEIGKISIDVIGFGEWICEETVFDDDIGIELSMPKVKLDSGKEILVRDAMIAEEYIILKEIDSYKSKGFIINTK
jgi:hypothetical protein